MNYLKTLCMLLIVLFLIPGCADNMDMDYNDEDPDDDVSTYAQESNLEQTLEARINPNRGYYEIVIVDSDHWEICLNTNRVRQYQYVTSYGCGDLDGLGCEPTGHLWYRLGSFTFEGPAAAVYDPINDTITVMALDAGWDRDYIIYTLKFVDETGTDLEGTVVYYEHPRRTYRISASLDKGKLGNHDASPSSLMTAESRSSEAPPLTHPKKERFEADEFNEDLTDEEY